MNASELRAAISRRRRTYRSLAKSIGISEQALYNKLDGKSEFKASEIGTIATELGLSPAETNYIFFSRARIKFTKMRPSGQAREGR